MDACVTASRGGRSIVAGVASSGFGSFRHLAVRFFGALDPRGPSPAEEAWAEGWLLPGEVALWRRMSGPDRRHAAGVAREVARLLGRSPREVMAAALLHDVGKVESGFGTLSRVAITLAAIGASRDRLTAPLPAGAPPWRIRVRDYLVHDAIGARLLQAAGSDPLTVCWTREHHQPPETWTVEPVFAGALKEADGD